MTHIPIEVQLGPNNETMVIHWQPGIWDSVSAAQLRAACRCPACTVKRKQGRYAAGAAHLTIEKVERHGAQGVHVAFSDGHDPGQFSWALLHRLTHEPQRDAE